MYDTSLSNRCLCLWHNELVSDDAHDGDDAYACDPRQGDRWGHIGHRRRRRARRGRGRTIAITGPPRGLGRKKGRQLDPRPVVIILSALTKSPKLRARTVLLVNNAHIS